MKNIKIIYTIALSILVFGVMVAASALLQNQGNTEEAIFTTEIRAAAITYKRTFSIKPKGSLSTGVTLTPVATSAASITPIQILTPIISISSTSADLTPTEVPLIISDPIETPVATAEANTSLPISGWMQNSIILFITSSTVIFISFLY